jgi:oligopeptidase A
VLQALAQARAALQAIAQDPAPPSWANTFGAFEQATQTLDELWGLVHTLMAVQDAPELRQVYSRLLPQVTAFYTGIYLDRPLWQRLRSYAQGEGASHTGLQARLIRETCQDFVDNGADLAPQDQERLQALLTELAQLTQAYAEHVLDATNAWELLVQDEAELDGLPELAKTLAQQSAKSKGAAAAYRFTLQAPSYQPLMQYAHSDALRRQVWEALNAIGTKPPWDNTAHIEKILALRHEKARLLGKPHFADLVLQRRMARSGQGALSFVEELHRHTRPYFERELAELEAYKASCLGTAPEPLQPWELAYWAERMRKARYDFDEEALRPYFPLDQVMAGLFTLCEKVFGICITQRPTLCRGVSQPAGSCTAPGQSPEPPHSTLAPTGNCAHGDLPPLEVWHPQVQCFQVTDARSQQTLGAFYADWYPREDKRSGAWMSETLTAQHSRPHLGLMAANLTPPTPDAPALLTHSEVETIFHELGHLLHHLLSQVPYRALSGTHVAWDFVELPSQIMENWCWERESLDLFARHYQTGAPLPQDLLDKMLKAKNYLAGMAMMRQLGQAKVDLELHIHYEQHQGKDLEAQVQDLLKGYVPRYKTPQPSIIRRFLHLFSDPVGYAAGYYSYHWAEVLDADAFTRFRQEGLLNPETGLAFREHILSRGNAEDPEVLFRRFMGRDPNPQALLARRGLTGDPLVSV